MKWLRRFELGVPRPIDLPYQTPAGSMANLQPVCWQLSSSGGYGWGYEDKSPTDCRVLSDTEGNFAVLSIWKYWYGPAHGGNTVKQYWTESQLQQDILTQQWHPQTKDALTLILLLISGQIFHSNNRTPKQVPIQWPETGFHLYLWIGAICFPTLGVLQYWDILTSGTKEGRWTHSKICSVTVK